MFGKHCSTVFQYFLTSDVVETETWLKFRDETSSKNSETETSNFVHFAEIKKNIVITSDLIFFQISGIFPTCFGCFLPANTTNKKSLNYRNFNKPFHCNIQSLETWNLRDRDSQKWVSRPRPSLETASLILTQGIPTWGTRTSKGTFAYLNGYI